jgi:hypothetical protein
MSIVGTSFHQDQLKAIYVYESRSGNPNKIKCELQAEPSNRYDPNAIKVVYTDKGTDLYGSILGYIKKEDTRASLYNKTVYIQIYYHLKYKKYCIVSL